MVRLFRFMVLSLFMFFAVTLSVVVFVPGVHAWDREECEEVHWDHPDCEWGRPPVINTDTHHHSSSREAGSVVKRVWYGISTDESTGCSTFIYAMVWPARVHPGTPTVVLFPERKAVFCSKKGGNK